MSPLESDELFLAFSFGNIFIFRNFADKNTDLMKNIINKKLLVAIPCGMSVSGINPRVDAYA